MQLWSFELCFDEDSIHRLHNATWEYSAGARPQTCVAHGIVENTRYLAAWLNLLLTVKWAETERFPPNQGETC